MNITTLNVITDGRTGRGPKGNLRNFRAMHLPKLRQVAQAILREGNDFAAEEAVLVALGVKA